MDPDREKSIPEPLCLHWRVCGQRPVQVLDRPHSLSMFSCPRGQTWADRSCSRGGGVSDHVMDARRVTFHPAAGSGEKGGYGFNQCILKEISPEGSVQGLMLNVKLQYFGP